MASQTTTAPFYGLLAEFESAQALLDAAQKVHDTGYTKTDAFSPFPVHGLAEALGFREHKVPAIILCGGIFGCMAGYGLEYWTQVIAFPENIGGRPYHAWVNFIPPAFEATILCAAFAAVFGMLALNGLPQPYHPVFNAKRFERASQDAFFLVIESEDPKFRSDETRAFLMSLNPLEVVDVEH